MMGKGVNLAFHAWVIIESIMVKFIMLGRISLQSGALKRSSNVGFYNDSSFKSYQALKMLDKQHYIFIVNVFLYWYYSSFAIYIIKM